MINNDAALINADWAFDRYEDIRPTLPQARFAGRSRSANHLVDLAEQYDAFILDAFGVLNRGDTPIPGAVARMKTLRDMGKRLVVLTNAASYTREQGVAKYRGLGFDFGYEDVISSRDIAFAGLPALPDGTVWAAAAMPDDVFADAPAPMLPLLDMPDLYQNAGGFLLLSNAGWGQAQTARLIEALIAKPRPLVVANPDLVAPRDSGLSIEPGAFAREIAQATGIRPQFFGKPYGNAFDAALIRLNGIDTSRIAMVGDTLHTDILGGAAAGLNTVLITDHGLFKGHDVTPYIWRSGIVPDWIIPTT